jgi:hypothetical protein
MSDYVKLAGLYYTPADGENKQPCPVCETLNVMTSGVEGPMPD